MSKMTDTWRLLITSPARGAWNMAVDEAILESAGRGAVLPTLRLYGWEPACLSLGYAQSYKDVDADRLRARGWDVVRRATGGRAILHIDELTYSVTAPPDEPRVQGSVLESYHRLARALVGAVRGLGLPVEMEKNTPASGDARGPVCFEVPSAYEIVVDGKKLIGSAQARKKEACSNTGHFRCTATWLALPRYWFFLMSLPGRPPPKNSCHAPLPQKAFAGIPLPGIRQPRPL